MTLEITFEKAHLNVNESEVASIVNILLKQRSYVMFRVNDQVEYTVVRHGNQPVWEDIEFRCAEQDIFMFQVRLATSDLPQPSDRIFGKGTWDFKQFLRLNHPERFDDHTPFTEEIQLKSPDSFIVVGRLFIRIKYIIGKLHIGGLMRFGQKIDLTNHALDISGIKLNENMMQLVNMSNAHGNSSVGLIDSQYRGGVPAQPVNNSIDTSRIIGQSGYGSQVQPGQASKTEIITININQPPANMSNINNRGSSPVDLFNKPPQPITPTTIQTSQVHSNLNGAYNQSSSAVISQQPAFGPVTNQQNQYQSATGLNYQTGHIGTNQVIGISSGNVGGPVPSGFQPTNSNIGGQSVYMSQTHQSVSTYPAAYLSVGVRDQQFTLIKGLADKLNIFSFLDAPNQKVEIAPGRVFNDFCKSRCRTQFPHSH